MAATDWRVHATPEAEQAFADAQSRLDEGDYPDGEAGQVLRQCDEALTDRYDRLVLQAAQEEFARKADDAEFARLFPEPPDGGRIEFEYGDGFHAAYRQDQREDSHDWWLYGENGDCFTWRRLIGEFELEPGGITYLAEKTERADRLEELARWLVSLDDPDPDPDSAGFQERRVTGMNQIITRARQALGEKE